MRDGNRRTFMTDCSAGAAGLLALSGAGGQPVLIRAGAERDAVSVHHVRDPVFGDGAAAGALSNLRGRAAVRESRRAEVDDARGAAVVTQEHHQARRARSLLDQHGAAIRDRPAGVLDPDRKGERPVGLRRRLWTTRRLHG